MKLAFAIGFLMIYGFVGYIEVPPEQVHIEESVCIRDALVQQASVQEKANQEYIMEMITRSKGESKP